MRIALVGFGSVGQGLASVLDDKKPPLDIDIVLAADSSGYTSSPDGLDPGDLLRRKQETGSIGDEDGTKEALGSVEYDVLVEMSPTTLGDAEPAYGYISTAIENGCDVVTSNKGPIGVRYEELMSKARNQGVEIRMEGAVGGAMPVINTVRDSLAGNSVLNVKGILNGTCNFILTRMLEEGLTYQHVLGEAQDMGIAEADPTFDVEGIDTALKCVIIHNVIFDENASLDDVEVTGITEVTPDSLRLARESGHVVKLIGEVVKEDLKVGPRLIPRGHSLDIGGTLNVVSFETEFAGEVTISGRGAGSRETASAVLSDLIGIGQSL